jgi:hypothetical protein
VSGAKRVDPTPSRRLLIEALVFVVPPGKAEAVSEALRIALDEIRSDHGAAILARTTDDVPCYAPDCGEFQGRRWELTSR